MSTEHLNEPNTCDEHSCSREEKHQRYPSTNCSTPNSSIGEKQFHFINNHNERSGQNSRASSFAESTVSSVNNEGFANFGDIIQHLKTVWVANNNQDAPRRTGNNSTASSTSNTNINEGAISHNPKGHSQQHYNHHQAGHQHNQYSGQQYWNNYGNPRRSGNGNYNRNYSGGNNEQYWNQKSNRFPSHRSMNNLMTNSVNYQQQSQSSPPSQRRQGDQQQYYHHEQHSQSTQSYYKKNRSDHERRPNGYTSQQQQQQQQSVDYSSINSASEQSSISSTQSYPSNLNSYNR